MLFKVDDDWIFRDLVVCKEGDQLYLWGKKMPFLTEEFEATLYYINGGDY